jgi:CubicO group peptidase (beta-lactamase class C family)
MKQGKQESYEKGVANRSAPSFALHTVRCVWRSVTGPTHGTDEELIRVLRAKLAEDTSAGKFSGVVFVAKDGAPLFEQAYGFADRERKIPNTALTRFRLGSINRVFTAVAALQLAEAGKIKLDDPLVNYIPDYPNQDLAQKVTIRELLNHTGGTGDIFGTGPNQLFTDEYRARIVFS